MTWSLSRGGAVLARGSCQSKLAYITRFVFTPSLYERMQFRRSGVACASRILVKVDDDPDAAWASITTQECVSSATIRPCDKEGWKLRIGFKDVFLDETARTAVFHRSRARG